MQHYLSVLGPSAHSVCSKQAQICQNMVLERDCDKLRIWTVSGGEDSVSLDDVIFCFKHKLGQLLESMLLTFHCLPP